MAHELAKLMLEQSSTFLDRTEAVRTAVFLGMPLRDIEGYLDWLETAAVRQAIRQENVRVGAYNIGRVSRRA